MKNTRTISLREGEKKGVVLDVNPQSVTIEYPMQSERTQLLGGEYIRIGKKGLRSLRLETFLPEKGTALNRSGKQCKEIASQLISWMNKGVKLKLNIAGIASGDFYITSLSKTANEGDGDMHIALELCEARELKRKSIKGKTVKKDGGAGKKGGGTYIVKKWDNLHKIAQKIYGDDSKWKIIYDANRKVIGRNPNLIYPGQKYTLPKI